MAYDGLGRGGRGGDGGHGGLMECSSRSSVGRVVPISASTSSLWAFDAEAEARASHEIEAVWWCEAGVRVASRFGVGSSMLED